MKFTFHSVAAVALLALVACSEVKEPVVTEPESSPEHQTMARDILANVVAMDTSTTAHGTPQMATYLASLFVEGGFAEEDVTLFEASDQHTALIVRYSGADPAAQGIAFLGHLDVVTAFAKDWELDPFELVERDGYFIGRGVADNKSGVVGVTATFLKLKADGYVPDRNLYLIFTADEETGMASTKRIVNEIVPDLNIEYALNSEGGGGRLNKAGEEGEGYYVQAAEKTYATLDLIVTNTGGHSSAPRPDNAIYQLVRALAKVEVHIFPVMLNEISSGSLARRALSAEEPLATAITNLIANPTDTEAEAIVSQDIYLNAAIRTTCITTMLDAGHAENALPQSARATINCRITPGMTPQEVFETLLSVIDDEGVSLIPGRVLATTDVTPMRDDVMAAIAFALEGRYPDITLIPSMSAGGTDGMYFREAGIPTYGLSGMFSVPGETNAHGLNEKVRVDSFYYSLSFWERLMKRLSGGAGE